MTFNIGNQNAANINNVGRDQHITGGQTGIVVTTEQALQALADLRAGVNATRLDPVASVAVETELRDIEAGLRQPEPDRTRIAPRLERLTRILLAAGSLASAGSASGRAPRHARALAGSSRSADPRPATGTAVTAGAPQVGVQARPRAAGDQLLVLGLEGDMVAVVGHCWAVTAGARGVVMVPGLG